MHLLKYAENAIVAQKKNGEMECISSVNTSWAVRSDQGFLNTSAYAHKHLLRTNNQLYNNHFLACNMNFDLHANYFEGRLAEHFCKSRFHYTAKMLISYFHTWILLLFEYSLTKYM